ncbi:unnamed protein product [Arctia plantaginis]|uniref:HAT C-terminal dimerisation domain-containing protein n=1 Tax=Arctia plantaginis TaxID=874455 RepID=A0A8S1AVL3_ARCPL|nr:unnamed protein product [Arctia plantaginis]
MEFLWTKANYRKKKIISPTKAVVLSKNTIVLANSRHLMEDDQPQASTSKISEDRDDCSSVTTLTSMDSETARELCLSNSIKNAFERISSNKAGGTKYNRIVQALIFFICQDMRPFNIVEGEGFLRLVKELEPTFKVPGAKYLKKMTTEKYEACITICKSKLSKIDNFCLTLDIWTETMNEVGFMGVTIHFVENGQMCMYYLATQLAHGHKKKKKSHQGDEVSLYLSNPVVSLKSNPFAEWDDMKLVFPCLYKYAQQYLIVVATSVPSECLFSKAGATMTQTRNRLSSKYLNSYCFWAILMLKSFLFKL